MILGGPYFRVVCDRVGLLCASLLPAIYMTNDGLNTLVYGERYVNRILREMVVA
jgi:hypothetical protein